MLFKYSCGDFAWLVLPFVSAILIDTLTICIIDSNHSMKLSTWRAPVILH